MCGNLTKVGLGKVLRKRYNCKGYKKLIETAMKNISEIILRDAVKLVRDSQAIDYKQIVANNHREVEKLRVLLHSMRKGTSTGAQDRTQQVFKQPISAPEDVTAVRKTIIQVLVEGGFENRLRQVYCSSSEKRSIPFKSVPHRRGLVDFSMVIAPDFAPQAGLHGIFITATQVYSALLANPAENKDWRVLKKVPYKSPNEMAELVTLLAAGFELP